MMSTRYLGALLKIIFDVYGILGQGSDIAKRSPEAVFKKEKIACRGMTPFRFFERKNGTTNLDFYPGNDRPEIPAGYALSIRKGGTE